MTVPSNVIVAELLHVFIQGQLTTNEEELTSPLDISTEADIFSRYAPAMTICNPTVKTTAEALCHYFIVKFGLLNRIRSDLGPSFALT